MADEAQEKQPQEQDVSEQEAQNEAAVDTGDENSASKDDEAGKVKAEEKPTEEGTDSKKNAKDAGKTLGTQDEIDELKTQLGEATAKLMRLRADFENFRRRSNKEKQDLSAVVLQDVLTAMLPFLDNFDRAVKADSSKPEAYRKGIEMIYTQYTEILHNQGLEPIETEGQKFDPNFHQAVMRVQNPDLEDDMIAMELQKGYMVKGHVIRPAMVQVVAN